MSTPSYPGEADLRRPPHPRHRDVEPRLRLGPVPLREVELRLRAGQAQELDAQGQGRDRAALHRPHQRAGAGQEAAPPRLLQAGRRSRMKKVDDIVTKPTITMAIQGMWVSDEPDSVYALPFDHCSTSTTAWRSSSTATRGCCSNSSTGGWSRTYRSTWTATPGPGSSRPLSS